MDIIGVIGGGTMGAGIAQLAAANGSTVHLLEVDAETARRALDRIRTRYARLVEKHRMGRQEAEAASARLLPALAVDDLKDCDVVIEAIVEDFDAKVAVLSRVRDIARRDTIFASNTSSLSITRLGEALDIAPRFCGMHFFNPAPVMPLVEIIAGERTDGRVLDRVAALATAWGKPAVRVKDTPGFVVNRVARPFYLEALRIIEEKRASCDAVDLILKEVGGFKMGPFELMDLVGIDVNYAVTCSVYEQLGKPARFKPSDIQARLVEQGKLGRKTGTGFYSYRQERPEIAYRLDVEPFELTAELRHACEALSLKGRWDIDVESGYLLARVLTALMNEAALAEQEGVATADDIDVAMKLGTNYPKGLLAWSDELGSDAVGAFLQALNATVPDRRFTPARRFC